MSSPPCACRFARSFNDDTTAVDANLLQPLGSECYDLNIRPIDHCFPRSLCRRTHLDGKTAPGQDLQSQRHHRSVKPAELLAHTALPSLAPLVVRREESTHTDSEQPCRGGDYAGQISVAIRFTVLQMRQGP